MGGWGSDSWRLVDNLGALWISQEAAAVALDDEVLDDEDVEPLVDDFALESDDEDEADDEDGEDEADAAAVLSSFALAPDLASDLLSVR